MTSKELIRVVVVNDIIQKFYINLYTLLCRLYAKKCLLIRSVFYKRLKHSICVMMNEIPKGIFKKALYNQCTCLLLASLVIF